MTTTTTSSKNNRFNDQNNSSACASRFSVHFFDVHDYEVKPPNLTFFGGRGHTTTNFPSTFWVKSLKIQLQEKWLTYWASPNKRDLVLPVNWVILCWYSWVRTDGRAYGHVITKISRMDGLPNFLNRYGAPLARTSRGAPYLHSHLNWRDKINITIKGKYKE